MLLGLVTVAFTVFFMGVLQGVMKASPAFQIAVTRAQQSPVVIKALGQPIKPGWFVSGEVHEAVVAAYANLSGRLEGPLGQATMTVQGRRSAGKWQLTIVAVVDKTGQRIDLSDPPPAK